MHAHAPPLTLSTSNANVQAAEALASTLSERVRHERDDATRAAEQRHADERASLTSRVEFAEARVLQLTGMRDEAQAGCASLKEQLVAHSVPFPMITQKV